MAAEVNRILRTAMAKDPADRYPTAGQLRDDLRRARTLSSAAPPVGVRRAPLVATAAVVAVVLVGAAIAWGVTRDQPVARSVDRPVGSLTPVVPESGPDPTGSTGPTDSTDPVGPLTAADARTAQRHLADALLGQGLLTEEQAACTAEEWIATAGLDRMVEDGLFDADLRFVDVPASQLSEETRSAATVATVTCAAG
jgi:serine/threonine-protein kinase